MHIFPRKQAYWLLMAFCDIVYQNKMIKNQKSAEALGAQPPPSNDKESFLDADRQWWLQGYIT